MGGGDSNRPRNVTTLDDDVSQSALRFVIRLDEALGFKDHEIHEAVAYAIQQLIRVQYPNDAWPQGYDHYPEPERFPIRAASYPETGLRKWPGSRNYWEHYTLNDNSYTKTIEMLLKAVRTYAKSQALSKSQPLAGVAQAAVRQVDEFLWLAQMPEPQLAWAQQYDFEMHPSWARIFEPPAISGGESAGGSSRAPAALW